MTPAEFQALCANLATALPAARALAPSLAAKSLQLEKRHELVFLGTRGCGKTSVAAASTFGQDASIQETGGLLDYTGQALPELARVITAMSKMVNLHQLPDYRPKIFIRPEIWAMLQKRLHWIGSNQVAEFDFPKAAFYQALADSGATADVLAWFGPSWLASCHDATQRLMPGFAFDVMAETVKRSQAEPLRVRAEGYAATAASLVKSYPDIAPILIAIAPADKAIYSRHQKLHMPIDRALIVLRKARMMFNVAPPHDLTGPQFVQFAEQAGIWKQTSRKYLLWSMPYAVGATYLKSRLTSDGLQRMLST